MTVKLTKSEKKALTSAIQIRKNDYLVSEIASKKHENALKKVENNLLDEPFYIDGFALHLFKGLINGEIGGLLKKGELKYVSPIERSRFFVLSDHDRFNKKLWNKIEADNSDLLTY